jgi:hypothetical protein
MAELTTTIGIDQSELEKGLANAGRTIGKMSGQLGAGVNPFQNAANKLGSSQGIGGLIAGPIGALVGAFIDAFGGMISAVMSKVKELAEYAMMLRRIQLTTGLKFDEVKKLEGFADSFGVSIKALGDSIVEFKKRMGEARIKGGEVTNILAKMGVGMDEVAKGTYDAQRAMKDLAEAYAAGTDEATLLYFGTKLFGDGFKELLPIIKAGSKAVEEASHSYYEGNKEAQDALGRAGEDLKDWGRSITNVFVSLLGSVMHYAERMVFTMKNLMTVSYYNPFESVETQTQRIYKNAPKHMTNDDIRDFVKGEFTDVEDQKRAMKELEKLLSGGKGKILSPYGLTDAGAASTLQQMGGGDIFGAIGFSPLERIATATEQTAINTAPDNAAPAEKYLPRPMDYLLR